MSDEPPDWLDDGPDDGYLDTAPTPAGAAEVFAKRAQARKEAMPAPPKPTPAQLVAPDLAALCARQPGRYKRIRTHCEGIDAITGGGIQTRRLVIVGGAPGVTKTGWTLAMARDMARLGTETAAGHAPTFVVFVAADEPRDGLLSRLGQMEGQSRADLEDEDLSVSTMAWANACAGIVKMPNLVLFDPREDEMSVERVMEWGAQQAKDRGARFVLVIDSIQVAAFDSDAVDPRARESTLREKIERRVKALRRFTIVHDAAAIVISELNRTAYQPGGEASLAAFKEAGGIEYGADLAMTMVRVETDDKREYLVQVTPQKNRMGDLDNLAPFRLRRERCLFHPAPMPMDDGDPGPDAEDLDAVRRAEHAIVVSLIQARGVVATRSDLCALAAARNAIAQRAVSNLLSSGRVIGGRGKPFQVRPPQEVSDE